MIQSMTGFASKLLVLNLDAHNKTNVSMSLKTLNSRYFEANCKLPSALSHLETKFIKVMKQKLHRGCIYLTVHLDNPSIFKGTVQPALNTVKSYLKAINEIRQECHITAPLNLDQIISLPHVFTMEEKGIDEEHSTILLSALDDLIGSVIEARGAEGAALRTDLEQRMKNLDHTISIIETRSKEQVDEQKQKVNEAISEVLADDESKIAEMRKNALYAILDKIDVHEEIVRFKNHIKTMLEILDSPESDNGKRLDFTLQELAREINTVSAKCSDSLISKHAINAKVEIEKAREQAQNIV